MIHQSNLIHDQLKCCPYESNGGLLLVVALTMHKFFERGRFKDGPIQEFYLVEEEVTMIVCYFLPLSISCFSLFLQNLSSSLGISI